MKTCKQCGEVKPLSHFRSYYGGRKGTYTMCKDCERLNAREKYLSKKGDKRTQLEDTELSKIHELYNVQRAAGLNPPRCSSERDADPIGCIDDMINKYAAASAVPSELRQWLSCDLTENPEYYLVDVYEALREKYRPVLKLDKNTFTPVYDDTYKSVLDELLDRFNEYEDSYYGG